MYFFKAHYVYICKKNPNADFILAENFQKVYNELEKLEMMDEENFTNEDEYVGAEEENKESNNTKNNN